LVFFVCWVSVVPRYPHKTFFEQNRRFSLKLHISKIHIFWRKTTLASKDARLWKLFFLWVTLNLTSLLVSLENIWGYDPSNLLHYGKNCTVWGAWQVIKNSKGMFIVIVFVRMYEVKIYNAQRIPNCVKLFKCT